MDKLTVGTATSISSSSHVDAADAVSVPCCAASCCAYLAKCLHCRPAERAGAGCYSFLWRRKSVRDAAPFTSSAAQRFLWAPDMYSAANAFCKCNWQPEQHQHQQYQHQLRQHHLYTAAAVTTKTCWLSFRCDSVSPKTERKYVKCKCISLGSVSSFKATITRNRVARQMRRHLHEAPLGTTFMPDNVEIRCEFPFHTRLSVCLCVCVKWPSVE